jgi:hypothetical protein
MSGSDDGMVGHTVDALPHDKLHEFLEKYNRLAEVK